MPEVPKVKLRRSMLEGEICVHALFKKGRNRGQKALLLSHRSLETEDLFLDLSTKMYGQEFRGTLKPGNDLAGRPERKWAEE